jgi:hypothetical protein
MKHISAEVNFPRLNSLMRQEAGQLGEAWTVDLRGFFCRHFDFEYVNTAAESDLHAEYQSLKAQFALEIFRPAPAQK